MFGKIGNLIADQLAGDKEDGHGAAPQQGAHAVQPTPQAMASPCNGNKKALMVGINYTGTNAALRGCINDVNNVRQYITGQWGFRELLVLTDDQTDPQLRPTKANIVNGMRWLVSNARHGDSLLFHYSGHGGSTKDQGGDEKDGMDETIYPVDFEQAGQILDDDMYDLLVKPLPQGVRLTCIYDSCHSGTVLDLPYVYKAENGHVQVSVADYKKDAFQALLAGGAGYFGGQKEQGMSQLLQGAKILAQGYMASRKTGGGNREVTEDRKNAADADVIQFAGCRDDQTSADASIGGQATGAMSWALMTTLGQAHNKTSYEDLLENVRKLLTGKYSQVPQMSTGRPVDLSSQFLL